MTFASQGGLSDDLYAGVARMPASCVLISTLTMTPASKEREPSSTQFKVIQLKAMLSCFKKL